MSTPGDTRTTSTPWAYAAPVAPAAARVRQLHDGSLLLSAVIGDETRWLYSVDEGRTWRTITGVEARRLEDEPRGVPILACAVHRLELADGACVRCGGAPRLARIVGHRIPVEDIRRA